MLRYVPGGTSVAGLTRYCTSSSSVVSPNDQPALNAARGEDVPRGEVDLEGRDACQRARGRADLRREVRQGGEIVAPHRRGVGEPAAGELHAVARVPGEADDHPLAFLDRLAHVVALC